MRHVALLVTVGILIACVIAEGKTLPKPYLVDRDGRPLFPSERSLCGKNDMIAMSGASQKFQELGTPIGIYSVDTGMGIGKCTGTLISKDLFLTAQHCTGECSSIQVTFGYLTDDRQESFKCKEIVEQGDEAYENDYMVVRLQGNPGVQWGWFDLSGRKLAKGHKLLMIHHPEGSPMKISKDCPVFEQTSEYINHRCDTNPGSSGSAILDPDFDNPENTRIVGVHTLGGCNDTATSFNSGPSMEHLLTISPLLKSMAKD